jgi:hypothetical protein
MDNLKKVKHATITWAHEKRLKEDQELTALEKKLLDWQTDPTLGYSSREAREELAQLELRRKTILADKEALWRLKSPGYLARQWGREHKILPFLCQRQETN